MNRRFALAGLMVLALGAAVRLHALDLIDFRYDEASAVRFGFAVAGGHLLTGLPFTGSVANHPALYAYLLALPSLFTRDVLAIAAYNIALDVAAIGLTLWGCRRHYGSRAALLAGLLYAMAPWPVALSRNLGVMTPPLFTVVLLAGLLEVMRRRNPRGWIAVGWGLAGCVGSHLSSAFLAPVVLFAVAARWRTLKPWPVLAGLAPCLVVGVGYAVHDALQGYAIARALAGLSGSPAIVNLDALWRGLWQSGGAHISDLTDGAFAAWVAQVPAALSVIDSAQMALLAAGLILLLARAAMDRGSVLLLVWWIAPIALQMVHTRPIQPHYLLVQQPVSFVVMALAVDAAVRFGQRRLRGHRPRKLAVLGGAAALAALAALLAWQVLTTVRLASFVERYDTSAGGYGLPLRNPLAVARHAAASICRQADCAGPGDVIVVSPGADPAMNEQAAILDVLLADTPRRFVDAGAGLILRPGAARYVFTPGAEAALRRMPEQAVLDASESLTLPARAGSPAAYVSVASRGLLDTSVAGPRASSEPLARWENGVELIGYRTEFDVERNVLRVETLLRVTQAPPAGADYHWFNHALVDGRKVGQSDSGGIHPSNWRAGDVVWQWFDLALADLPVGQPLTLRIGCYTYPDIQNVPLMLPDGTGSDGVALAVRPDGSWQP